MEVLNSLGIDWKLFLGQIVNFAILLYLLKRFVYKKFLDILRKRKEKIELNIKRSKELEEKTREIFEEKEKILINARKKASIIIDKSKSKAEKETEEIFLSAEKAKKDILERAKKEAMIEAEKIKNQGKRDSFTIALKLAEKILKEKIDSAKDEKIIRENLAMLNHGKN